VTRPQTRLTDLAGIDSILQQIRELVFYPTQFPALYAHLGVSPPCGILLHGSSGCGKTMLASAIAGELGLPFFEVYEMRGGGGGDGGGFPPVTLMSTCVMADGGCSHLSEYGSGV
jgi:ribosome biogenesis ATPase